MKLAELSPAERAALASALGCSAKYLYQVATGAVDSKTGRPRQLGTTLCRRAVAFDPRLSLADLRPDIWGEPSTGSPRTRRANVAYNRKAAHG